MKLKFTFLLLAFTTAALAQSAHSYNGNYSGQSLSRIAFPIGGMGTGMFCLEGTGAVSHMSVRHSPDLFNEPVMFGAIGVKGKPGSARVLEGPVPDWKKFGMYNAGNGQPGADWGLARFSSAVFGARFPFANIELTDKTLPLRIKISGWNPFIPTDADDSSLPVGGIEYTFTNTGKEAQDYVFSYNAENFMSEGGKGSHIDAMEHGFVLAQDTLPGKPESKGAFAMFTDEATTTVNHCWFRGGWFDPLTIAWKNIKNCSTDAVAPVKGDAPGASLYVPFHLAVGQSRTIRVYVCWYVPDSHLRSGQDPKSPADVTVADRSGEQPSKYYKPWYSSRFGNINELAAYWRSNYNQLKAKTQTFTSAFYATSLPPEVTEAVAANLCILKTTTVMRQYDGRFWGWEGSYDDAGSCEGTCTHVWNYAQALCHLFPAMERSIRETEFGEDEDSRGHQTFRAALPIRPLAHDFYAAADGQLGGIMKIYRDWHISGDSAWALKLYPAVKRSLDYCIATWDPAGQGAILEPHHNTYDIEFWGAEPLCTGFYAGALEAFIQLSKELKTGADLGSYEQLYQKARLTLETKLYNGEYFEQHIQWQGLQAKDPLIAAKTSFSTNYSPEALQILQTEGPKYQYGKGCLSDGMLGAWMAQVCGLAAPLYQAQITSHLQAVYKYNFKSDLSDYSNPQRSTYALGNEGGLLLCTWPKGGALSLPFVYSNEVWTGIEYEVASHLIFEGKIQEGLNIVKTTRKRYDGTVRNPFDEYECGHWYARAMSSYALLEAFTGVRYDAVTQTLFVHSRVGDFTSFLSTDTGFGNVIYKNGEAKVKVAFGKIEVKKVVVEKG